MTHGTTPCWAEVPGSHVLVPSPSVGDVVIWKHYDHGVFSDVALNFYMTGFADCCYFRLVNSK